MRRVEYPGESWLWSRNCGSVVDHEVVEGGEGEVVVEVQLLLQPLFYGLAELD